MNFHPYHCLLGYEKKSKYYVTDGETKAQISKEVQPGHPGKGQAEKQHCDLRSVWTGACVVSWTGHETVTPTC